jgi:hypothetical protein
MPGHFTDERWADYARGVSSGEDAAAIEQHLRNECHACLQSFRFWRTLAEYTAGEARIDIPEPNLRASRVAYAEWWRLYSLPRRARMARLIFDSVLQPLAAGVRGAGISPRRILASLGSLSVDLRLESSSERRILLTGQVLRSGKAAATPLNSPIVLMSGSSLVTETSANEFGEFELQFDQANGLQLYIEVGGKRPIGINLPDMVSRPEAGKSLTGQ